MNTAMYRRSNDELLSGPNLRLRIGEHIVDTGALRIVTRPDLPRLTSKAVAVLVELVRDAGQTVKLHVLGLATIGDDVSPELALATISSVEVLGAFRAPRAVKAALADRTNT